MVKKLIVRIKTGEETNKTAKLRQTFFSRDTVILGKISTNQVLTIKETKSKEVAMFLYS